MTAAMTTDRISEPGFNPKPNNIGVSNLVTEDHRRTLPRDFLQLDPWVWVWENMRGAHVEGDPDGEHTPPPPPPFSAIERFFPVHPDDLMFKF
ncbi:hypothetical protein Hdeb2414_s0016g00491751 [Helianthus debilis subsp. tardiflorus]